MPNWSSLRWIARRLRPACSQWRMRRLRSREYGDNAAEGLEGVRQAQADLDAAVTEFEDAKEAVNIPSQEVAGTLG